MRDDSKPTVDAKGRSEPPAEAREERVQDDTERYRDREEIARGGMGRVVEATDTLLGRRVAVKEALGNDPEALKRFAREIRITARLEHPSIVPVYDAGNAPDGSPFYVMRKVSGKPLEELVAAAESVPQRLALLPHVLAAANAVAHAHRRGIVHRDLKPSNILVGDLGETVVIDWGLAKVIDDPDDEPAPNAEPITAGDSLRTRIGTVFGTPGFMSPEQLRGEPVDERSDVYALGATLYHMLARRPPHAGASGTEMMGAAQQGPPQSIRELVPGIPPELSTIVDTALAYDDKVRYPNAGALAEDLQRCLMGQLVASHRYSTRERIGRFMRKYKVAVCAVAVAVVAITIAGAISITRVIAARDRTNAALEQALVEKRSAEASEARATDRANQLTLAQARRLVDSNPTAAVALVKPLASSPVYWREVRDIAAAARSGGAAWGMPGPVTIRSLELSPTGTLAVVSDDDGRVRLYDLVARTQRELVAVGTSATAFFADDGHVVVSDGRVIRVVTLATGSIGTFASPTAVSALVATSQALLWSDEAGAVWRTDFAFAPPRKIALPARAEGLSRSPDERWLGVQGAEHYYLVDLATEAVTTIGNGAATDVGWDPSGKSVGLLVGKVAYDVTLGPRPVVARTAETVVPLGVARFGDNLVYIQTVPLGIATLGPNGRNFRAPLEAISSRMKLARNDVVISDTGGGRLLMVSEDRDFAVQAPTERLYGLATSLHGHFVVAAMETRILIWDLDVLLPKRIDVGAMMSFMTIGADQLIVRRIFGPWAWFDLRTGESTEIQIIDPMAVVTPGPSADRAIVISSTGTHVIFRDGRPPTLLPDVAVLGIALPDDRALIATKQGEIIVYGPGPSQRQVLVARESEPMYIAWDKYWYVAQFADGVVWRHNEQTGASATLTIGPQARVGYLVHVTSDGRMFIADGDEVMRWDPDGKLTRHAKLPFQVIQVFGISEDTAIVITLDHAAYMLDFSKPDEVVSTVAAGAELIWISGTSQLALVSAPKRGVDVIDLLNGSRWNLGGRPMLSVAQITLDGSRVVQMLAQDAVGVWPLELPTKREQVAPWVESISNATSEHGPTNVTWRD